MQLKYTLARHVQPVTAAIFLPNDQLATSSGDKTFKIWNLQNGRMEFAIQGHQDAVTCLALLPNGSLASGSADLTVRIWDLKQRLLIRGLKGHKFMILSLQVMKTGHLASCSSDGTIKLWDVGALRAHQLTLSALSVKPICSPLGMLSNGNLVSCSFHLTNGLLKVWDLYGATKKLVSQMNTRQSRVSRLLVLPNDYVVLGSLEGTIQMYNVIKKTIFSSLKLDGGLSEAVWSLAILPNGYLLASYADDKIRVWNPRRGSQVQTRESGHEGLVTGMTVSPDGKQLVTVSNDCLVKVWSLTN